jgi:hypothetical protein
MKTIIAILLFVILVAGATIVVFKASDQNSSLGQWISYWKQGKVSFEQKADGLAKDIRHVPAMAKLQPWALDAMARFRTGQIHTNGTSDLSWTADAVKLAPAETPDFIKAQWGYTNKFGEVWPEVEMVLTNGQPDFIVLNWLNWGLAVGPPEYQISFATSGNTEVAPGIYTFFMEQ